MPAVPLPCDPDPLLQSLLVEFQAQMAALNELLHPVRSGDPRRIVSVSDRISELKDAILTRRRELAAR